MAEPRPRVREAMPTSARRIEDEAGDASPIDDEATLAATGARAASASPPARGSPGQGALGGGDADATLAATGERAAALPGSAASARGASRAEAGGGLASDTATWASAGAAPTDADRSGGSGASDAGLDPAGFALEGSRARYRVEGELGRGGMGVVYRAFDQDLGREVALKVVLDARAADRFVEEAQATAQLQHPGIVPVYDLGRAADGTLCFVMKLVRGRTLAQVIAAARGSATTGPAAPSARTATGAEGARTEGARTEGARTVAASASARTANGVAGVGDEAARASAPTGADGERPYTLFRLLEVFIEVARAVAFAHERGVVHRDLKPQNVMVGAHGEVLVMDWGIAKVLARAREGGGAAAEGSAAGGAGAAGGADPAAAAMPSAPRGADEPTPRPAPSSRGVVTTSQRDGTLVGAVIGTPAYMSPEQAAGDGLAVGPLSDVYALGATLYAILTGRPPFTAGDASALLQKVASPEPPIAPRALDRSIPRELEAICLKALAKDPAARYPSAASLAEDVHAYLEGQPVSALPEGLLGRAVKAAKRHRAVTATIAVAVLLGLLGSLAALVRLDRARRVAVDERARAEARAREARFNLERVYHGNGAGALTEGDARTAAILFAEALALADQPDTRERLLEARAACARLVWSSRADPEPWIAAWSPDGRRAVIAGRDGVLRVLDAETGAPLVERAVHDAPVRALAFRPDGGALASASHDGTVRVLDPADLGERLVLGARGGKRQWAAAWSPDGRRLATGGADRAIHLYDAATGAEVSRLEGHEDEVSGVAFDASGARLASTSWDLSARVWDLASGVEALRLADHGSWVHGVAFTPDGREVVTIGDAVRFFDARTGARLDTLRLATSVHALSMSPDGRHVAVGAIGAGLRVIELAGRRVRVAQRPHGPQSEWPGVAVSPDGRRVLTAGVELAVQCWELPPDGLEQGASLVATIPGHRREVWLLQYAPDGRLLSASADGTARVFDPATGRTERVLAHGARVLSVAASPDGRRAATSSADHAIRLWSLEGAAGGERAGGGREAESGGGEAGGAAGGAPLAVLRGHGAEVLRVVWSPDGRCLASAGGSDQTIRVWDAATAREERAIAGDAPIDTVEWSRDGRLVASTSAGAVTLHDPLSGAALGVLGRHDAEADRVIFHPDGRRLASVSRDMTARVWDLEGKREVARVDTGLWLYDAAWSADGRRLYLACDDDAIRIWNVASGAIEHVLRAHGASTCSLSPDGRFLATSSTDPLIRIWRLAEVERLFRAPPGDLRAEVELSTGLRVDGLDIVPAAGATR